MEDKKIRCIDKKRCIIGEGPIWNRDDGLLYFVNPREEEICTFNLQTEEFSTRHCIRAAAIAFDIDGRMIVSTHTGVFYLNSDNSTTPLYDTSKYEIKHGNDMKVGPDGRIYVGTQSGRRFGDSDKIDGKLYSIDKLGNVKILLDGLILSNGLAWSADGLFLYHTDSATKLIKEYSFDKDKGEIVYTCRSAEVPGVDGFTVGNDGFIYAACWGRGHIAVIDTADMQIVDYIALPTSAPASCVFCGKDMKTLAIVTASLDIDTEIDTKAGFLLLIETETSGILPYRFSNKS